MTKYREILRLHSQGLSGRSIASSCQCSRNTVSAVLERAERQSVSWPFKKDMTDANLQELLFPEKSITSNRKLPDCEHVHKEMAKSGVTLSLLWHEYCEQCRLSGEIPLMYSQFCRYYRKYAHTTKATMRIKRKPGELLEVDWAGQTTFIIDNITGEFITVYVFVATLSCSQYAYVEAFLSMNMESWITAHVNTYNYFGGVTRILVPDNLKTGVDKVSRHETKINKTYHEMAEYYGTAVIPARVKHPKDKPVAEGTVGIISTWIIASLRHQQFFSLQELNSAMRLKLEEFNQKPFQKRQGSRKSAFLEEEKALLLPLPATPYELATWSMASVQYDYHVIADKNHYSVPFEYIRHKVDVRMTSKIIEVFFHNHRIASHVRVRNQEGQVITVPDHMPEKHKRYLTVNSEYFKDWAVSVGPHAAIVIKAILSAHKVEKQGYRSCTSLMKLADKYSLSRFEEACERALSYTPSPSFKSIQTILKTGQDKVSVRPDSRQVTKRDAENFGFVRGADYYGGKEND